MPICAPMHGKPDFLWPLRVYWEDTDAGGIVFYANYLKYFERARTEWLRAQGLGQRQLKDSTGGMFVVSDTHLRYLRPARLDDALVVRTRVLSVGRASLGLEQEVLLISEQESNTGRRQAAQSAQKLPSETGTLLCQGTIRIGWVDAASLVPARIPAHILKALQ